MVVSNVEGEASLCQTTEKKKKKKGQRDEGSFCSDGEREDEEEEEEEERKEREDHSGLTNDISSSSSSRPPKVNVWSLFEDASPSSSTPPLSPSSLENTMPTKSSSILRQSSPSALEPGLPQKPKRGEERREEEEEEEEEENKTDEDFFDLCSPCSPFDIPPLSVHDPRLLQISSSSSCLKDGKKKEEVPARRSSYSPQQAGREEADESLDDHSPSSAGPERLLLSAEEEKKKKKQQEARREDANREDAEDEKNLLEESVGLGGAQGFSLFSLANHTEMLSRLSGDRVARDEKFGASSSVRERDKEKERGEEEEEEGKAGALNTMIVTTSTTATTLLTQSIKSPPGGSSVLCSSSSSRLPENEASFFLSSEQLPFTTSSSPPDTRGREPEKEEKMLLREEETFPSSHGLCSSSAPSAATPPMPAALSHEEEEEEERRLGKRTDSDLCPPPASQHSTPFTRYDVGRLSPGTFNTRRDSQISIDISTGADSSSLLPSSTAPPHSTDAPHRKFPDNHRPSTSTEDAHAVGQGTPTNESLPASGEDLHAPIKTGPTQTSDLATAATGGAGTPSQPFVSTGGGRKKSSCVLGPPETALEEEEEEREGGNSSGASCRSSNSSAGSTARSPAGTSPVRTSGPRQARTSGGGGGGAFVGRRADVSGTVDEDAREREEVEEMLENEEKKKKKQDEGSEEEAESRERSGQNQGSARENSPASNKKTSSWTSFESIPPCELTSSNLNDAEDVRNPLLLSRPQTSPPAPVPLHQDPPGFFPCARDPESSFVSSQELSFSSSSSSSFFSHSKEPAEDNGEEEEEEEKREISCVSLSDDFTIMTLVPAPGDPSSAQKDAALLSSSSSSPHEEEAGKGAEEEEEGSRRRRRREEEEREEEEIAGLTFSSSFLQRDLEKTLETSVGACVETEESGSDGRSSSEERANKKEKDNGHFPAKREMEGGKEEKEVVRSFVMEDHIDSKTTKKASSSFPALQSSSASPSPTDATCSVSLSSCLEKPPTSSAPSPISLGSLSTSSSSKTSVSSSSSSSSVLSLSPRSSSRTPPVPQSLPFLRQSSLLNLPDSAVALAAAAVGVSSYPSLDSSSATTTTTAAASSSSSSFSSSSMDSSTGKAFGFSSSSSSYVTATTTDVIVVRSKAEHRARNTTTLQGSRETASPTKTTFSFFSPRGKLAEGDANLQGQGEGHTERKEKTDEESLGREEARLSQSLEQKEKAGQEKRQRSPAREEGRFPLGPPGSSSGGSSLQSVGHANGAFFSFSASSSAAAAREAGEGEDAALSSSSSSSQTGDSETSQEGRDRHKGLRDGQQAKGAADGGPSSSSPATEDSRADEVSRTSEEQRAFTSSSSLEEDDEEKERGKKKENTRGSSHDEGDQEQEEGGGEGGSLSVHGEGGSEPSFSPQESRPRVVFRKLTEKDDFFASHGGVSWTGRRGEQGEGGGGGRRGGGEQGGQGGGGEQGGLGGGRGGGGGTFTSQTSLNKKKLHEDDGTADWYKHKRHVLIFTFSGKPVYSRYGNEERLSAFTGALSAIVAKMENFFFFQKTPDCLRYMAAGDHRFVFLRRGPLYLAAIDAVSPTVEHIRVALMLVHRQLLCILTKGIETTLYNRPNFDVRPLLGGTDSILRRLLSHYSSSLLSVLYSSAGTPQLPQLPSHHASSSANNLSTSTRNASGLSKAPSAGAPSFSPSSSSRGRGKEGEGGGDELDKMEVAWLEENGGFEPLPLNATMRHIACNMLKTFTTTHVLASLILADHRVVAMSLAKNFDLKPTDLLLLTNFVMASPALRQAESWTPFCLPGFNDRAFLYMYVRYMTRNVCYICLSSKNDGEQFFALSSHCTKTFALLTNTGCMNAIERSREYCPYSLPRSLWGSLALLHVGFFLPSVKQFFSSAYSSDIDTGRKHPIRDILNLYVNCNETLKNAKLPTHAYVETEREKAFVWRTADFHLYVAVPSWIDLSTAVIEQLAKWVMDQKAFLFLLGVPTITASL